MKKGQGKRERRRRGTRVYLYRNAHVQLAGARFRNVRYETTILVNPLNHGLTPKSLRRVGRARSRRDATRRAFLSLNLMVGRISAYPATSRSRGQQFARERFRGRSFIVVVVVVVSSRRNQLGTAG